MPQFNTNNQWKQDCFDYDNSVVLDKVEQIKCIDTDVGNGRIQLIWVGAGGVGRKRWDRCSGAVNKKDNKEKAQYPPVVHVTPKSMSAPEKEFQLSS